MQNMIKKEEGPRAKSNENEQGEQGVATDNEPTDLENKRENRRRK